MRILPLCCLASFLAAAVPAPALADFEDTVERSFDVKAGGTLAIESDRGTIEITTGTAERVEVTLVRKIDSNNEGRIERVLDNLDLSFDHNGADVTITARYDQDMLGFTRPNLQLRFRVTVPATYDVDLKTSGGSIKVADLTGDAVCRTSGGSITLQNIEGDVRARTSGGSINLAGAAGKAELNTSGGSITVGEGKGIVNAQTSGGSIHIDHAGADVVAHTSGGRIEVNDAMGSLDASTSGGSITAYLSGQPDRDCSLTTSGGSIHLYVNPEVNATIDARTSGGGISTDLPLTISGNLSRNHINARLNNGGPAMTLRTSGGGISLAKK